MLIARIPTNKGVSLFLRQIYIWHVTNYFWVVGETVLKRNKKAKALQGCAKEFFLSVFF